MNREQLYFRKQSSGFTLIEIMLVVIIIAALAAMAVPRLV
ncbi:MAG: prepilin-type N-terminal cleavage/methylation domain-containing protein, partial [Candidatus Omnitrophica bacterium]|nr:prepilin-type N-terminal cleavage/methylation domain-containing protein [Candidatus Omnitrophota bacterium]